MTKDATTPTDHQAQAQGPAYRPLLPGGLSEAQISQHLNAQRWIYLVVGPNVWGKGFTLDQARDAAGKPKQYLVYATADPWTYVDGMGCLTYTPRTTFDGPGDGPGDAYVLVGKKGGK